MFEWGKVFPWIECEIGVSEDRDLKPRVRCHYCYRNKPKTIKVIAKSFSRPKLYQKKKPVVHEAGSIEDEGKLEEKREFVVSKGKAMRDRWSSSCGRPIIGITKRLLEDHAITGFHA